MIRNRPELAPHFLLNIESQYELGPGEDIKETPNPDERETLQIMSNINFQALQATPGATPGDPRITDHGRLSYFSDSSGTDGGPNMRFTFD